MAKAAQIYEEIMSWNQKYTTSSLEELEDFLREKRLAFMKDLMSAGLDIRAKMLTKKRPRCPSCGSFTTYEGIRIRCIKTLEGMAKVKRPYYSCRSCGKWISPLDEHLRLNRCSCSERIRKALIALTNDARLSFQKTTELLEELTGIWISPATAYRLTREAQQLGLKREREISKTREGGLETLPRKRRTKRSC